MSQISISRIYHHQTRENLSIRILIDRMWPRGIKKDDANVDYWFKEVAPSSELRKWFGHKPERFQEFRLKYLKELQTDETKRAIVMKISQLAKEKAVTLLYSAKDEEHNNAVVLLEELRRILKSEQADE